VIPRSKLQQQATNDLAINRNRDNNNEDDEDGADEKKMVREKDMKEIGGGAKQFC